MIIERLSREHRNIEKLLTILERELEVFDCGDRPDYEVIRAIISYFEVYPEVYHHPQEDLVFAKLRTRDAAAAAQVGDLAREHHKGAERLQRVAQAIDNVLADREVLRQNVDTIVRDFIEHERRHMMMEDRDFILPRLRHSSLKIGRRSPPPSPAVGIRCSAMLPRSGSMRYAHIFCSWSKRLKPNGDSRGFIGIA